MTSQQLICSIVETCSKETGAIFRSLVAVGICMTNQVEMVACNNDLSSTSAKKYNFTLFVVDCLKCSVLWFLALFFSTFGNFSRIFHSFRTSFGEVTRPLARYRED